MAITLNISDWSVLPPGAQESGGLGFFTAVVSYIGPWNQRILFADKMMGFQYFPLAFDRQQGFSLLNAPFGTSYTIKAFKGEQQVIKPRVAPYDDATWLESYEKAVVTVTFGLPGTGDPYQSVGGEGQRPGGLISETFEPNAEFSTLDNDRFEWFDESVTPQTLSAENKKVSEKEAPGKLFVGIDYVFTRHGVTSVSPEVFTAVNHVNSEALRLITPILSGIEFAPETMLYRGARMQRSVNVGGESNLDLVMTFSIRQVVDPDNPATQDDPGGFFGWNHFFHAGEGQWLRLARKRTPGPTTVDDIHKNYPEANLKLL